MVQVVDSSNLVEFVQTGRVPEFKAPEAREPARAGAAPPAGAPDGKGAASDSQPAQARDANGKFTSAKEGDTTTPATARAAKSAYVEEVGIEGGENLPEAVTKAIGKKHRQMKEAEERERRETLRAIRAESEAADLKRQLAESDSKSRP